MGCNVTQKLIKSLLVLGQMHPGEPIAISIDQTLTQDATGTVVIVTLEALGLDRARTELSVQYVDHNLIQEDFRNPDDRLFLESAARRFGLWYSRPGNGVSHPLHTTYFARPGGSLYGSNIAKISEFVFRPIDCGYSSEARDVRRAIEHASSVAVLLRPE